MADIFPAGKRSEIMSKIKATGSKTELLLRKSLFNIGIRYRVNGQKILGKPDIYIKKYKIAIFVDGDWWHGRNYENEYSKYPKFWRDKILNNMNRDKLVNRELKKDGWVVLRFWQKDVEKDVQRISTQIASIINGEVV